MNYDEFENLCKEPWKDDYNYIYKIIFTCEANFCICTENQPNIVLECILETFFLILYKMEAYKFFHIERNDLSSWS